LCFIIFISICSRYPCSNRFTA